MVNYKIENILTQIRRAKAMNHSAPDFYNLYSIKKRALYKDYIAENDISSLIDSAFKYTNNNLELSFVDNRYSEIFRYIDGGEVEKMPVKQLSGNLNALFEAMKTSGIKDMLIKKHNMRCTDNDLDALAITESQFDAEFDVATNNRSKLPILYLKNVFWLQKYLRMFKNLQLQEIFSQNFKGDETPENINYLLYMAFKKYEILDTIYFEEKRGGNREMPMCLSYREVYKNIFDDIFPNSENDISMDYQMVYEYKSILDNLNSKKNMLLETLIKSQIRESQANVLNQTIPSWGVIKSEESISVGFEPEGYMLTPVFNYKNKYVYSQILTTPQMRTYPYKEFYPIYLSREDEKLLTPSVLVKPTPEQIKEIKLQSKRKWYNQEIYKRVLCQINGKPYPHEKTNIINLSDLKNQDRRNEIGESR